jgi:AcrR family transcriptional regulator
MPPSQTSPTRSSAGARRGPGGRGAGLTRVQIVERAIALMDEQGATALTMRRLARELGVESPALYWHFESKDALCRAVVDTVGAQLQVATVTGGSPRRRLEHHFTAIRDHWREHPSVLELSRSYPPSAGGEVSRAGLDLLSELGVSPDAVLDCYRALSWTVTGFVILEQSIESSVHHRRLGPTRWVLTIDGDPDTTSAFDTDDLFHTTLGLALDGLEHRTP